MSGISTHVLDTSAGKPAVGVMVTLALTDASGEWKTLLSTRTDSDGRCCQLLPAGTNLTPGQYRIRFDTGAYYAAQSLDGLYPFVEIAFLVRERDEHLHIPLLLTSNGFTTYRGS